MSDRENIINGLETNEVDEGAFEEYTLIEMGTGGGSSSGSNSNSTSGTSGGGRRTSGGSLNTTGSSNGNTNSQTTDTTNNNNNQQPASVTGSSSSSSTSEEWSSSKTGNVSSSSLLYYEQYPATPFNYSSNDIYGVNLISLIYHYNQNVSNDGFSAKQIEQLTSLFNISTEQATLLLTTYGEYKVDNNFNALSKKCFINNFNIKLLEEKINNNEINIERIPFKEYNAFKIKCIKGSENNTTENNLEFIVFFTREYPFKSLSLAPNKLITLGNNDYNVRFNIINEQSNLQINYCDIKRYLWFNVQSYSELVEIGISFYGNTDENDKTTVVLPLNINGSDFETLTLFSELDFENSYKDLFKLSDSFKPDNSFAIYEPEDITANYSDFIKQDNKILNNFNSDNILEESVDYFFTRKTLDVATNKYAAYIKLYISDGFLHEYLKDIKIENIKNIEVFLKFEKSTKIGNNINVTNILESKCIIASGNSSCTVDYVKPIQLYSVFNYLSENEPVVIYKLNSNYESFEGTISVYYGNQLVYPLKEESLVDSIGEKKIVKANGEEYKSNVFCYYTKTEGEYLYVYFKLTKSNNFTFNRFIIINFADLYSSSGSVSNIVDDSTKINGKISQETITVHSINRNIPQISKGDSTVYIDDSINNKTKHYNTYTLIDTINGSAYYGVRAFAYVDSSTEDIKVTYFDNTLAKIGIPGLSYDVNARIVNLKEKNEESVIYSFTNGSQKLILNKANCNISIDENEHKFKTDSNIHDILASDIFSYEYIIEGKTNVNFNYRGIYANKNLVPVSANYQDIRDKNSYWAEIEYKVEETLSSKEYFKISNITPDYPIYYNIDDDLDNNAYEYEFVEKSLGSFTLEDADNIYKKVIDYVKIPASSISLDTFKKIVHKSADSNTKPCQKYYKYSSISNKYLEYTEDDIKGITSIPLNIYTRYEYYLKTGEITDAKSLQILQSNRVNDEQLEETKRYSKVFSKSTTTSPKQNNYTYFKDYDSSTNNKNIIFNGFVRDGSVKYYGFILDNYSLRDTYYNNNINEDKKILSSKDTYIYLKQDFRKLEDNIDKTKYQEYRVKGYDLYINENENETYILDFVEVSNNATIYDIDTSGNTIYASGDSINDIFSLTDIVAAYNNLSNIWNDPQYSKENIERTPGSKYLLENFTIADDKKIKYIISLTGNYQKLEEFPEGKEQINVFIKEEGYNKFIDSKNSTLLTKIRSYKSFDNNLYAYLRKLLDSTELVENYKFLQHDEGYFYRTDTGYKSVNEKTGIVSGMNYIVYQPKYVISYDIHMSVNKEYFIYTDKKISVKKVDDNITSISGLGFDKFNKPITYNGNEILSISFFENKVAYYTYSENSFESFTGSNNITNISNVHSDYINYKGSCYTDNLIFETKYFYPSYCINDGIKIDKDGSYYTTAMVFDGKEGKIAKKLILNNHIKSNKKYIYTIDTYTYVPLDKDADLESLSKLEYSNYYISYNNGSPNWNNIYYQLNEFSQSPSYYLSNNYIVSIKQLYAEEFDYSGLDNQLKVNGNPGVIKMDNNLYGIVFNEDPQKEITTSTIAFNNNKDYLDNLKNLNIIQLEQTEQVKKWSGIEDDENSENSLSDDIISGAVLSANNEVYYNNYPIDGTTELYYEKIKFKPADFLYEIVQLSLFNFRNYNSDMSFIQTRGIESSNIEIEKPFSISNKEEVKFTGTYSWIPPEYKDVIVNGKKQTIIAYDGYFKKDYKKEIVPLNVTSYNFYPKDEISSINISYNFIPNSYILTAEIEHPQISYDYVVNNMIEKVKYSYILNGFEYDYPGDFPISFENGAYYGTINMLDIDNTYNSKKVPLYKKNDVVSYSEVKEIIHQEQNKSYEYFAYYQATPLTNEKIPVLYNTELIPATTHKVQYWDVSKNSYATKTVIDSYSYYSYKYKYDTIPFQVASYIYTDDLRISNFNDLGAYIDNIAYNLGGQIGQQTYSVNSLTAGLSTILRSMLTLEETIANERNAIFRSYIHAFDNSLKTLDNNTNDSLNVINKEVNSTLNDYSNNQQRHLKDLKDNLSSEINSQAGILKTGLTETKNIIDRKFESFENKFHDDIIGEEASKNVQGYLITTTYNPIINEDSGILSGYSYNIKTENIELEFGGNSIGQILSYTLGTVYSESDIEINEDGSYVVTSKDKYAGIAEILSKLSIENRIPNYNQFMISLVPKLYSSIDFDNPYDIVHDVEGNVVSQKMRNPTDMAKKCIMRADVLWTELKKKNIVE